MEFSRFTFKAAQWVCLIVCFAALALAQSERGTITGTVRDASGAVVPAANITITNTATNVAINATSQRRRRIHRSQPAAGHLHRSRRKIRVPSHPRKKASTSMPRKPSAPTRASSRHLHARPSKCRPPPSPCRPKTRNRSTTLQNKLVNDLPLVVSGTVRTPFDLAALTPDAKNLGGDNGFSIGGGQAASYGTTLDGVSANTTRALQKSWVASNSPSVEAIDQFTVDSNGFKAEYGHAAAAS